MDDGEPIPDDYDDFGLDVDPDALVEMEQGWAREEEEQRQAEAQAMAEAEAEAMAHGAGQSAPRKLDFKGFGTQSHFSDPMQPPSGSQVATAPLSSQLQLRLDTGSQLHRPPAVAPAPAVSHFQREREEEDQRQRSAHADSHAMRPQHTASSMFPSPAALPPLMRSVSELRQKVMDDEKLYVYRRAPVVGEFMPITNEKGDRMFLTMSTQKDTENKMSRDLGQLNVRRMLRELEAESTAASMAASLAAAQAREYESDEGDDERVRLRKRRQRKERLIARLDKEEQARIVAGKNSQLWVDKYTPKSYADLLSPEHINREVLNWLRGWDLCVFGAKKSSEAQAAAAPRTLDNHMLTHNMMAGSAKKKKPAALMSGEGDTDIRPEHKIILLCGPPGLGKTTLAHLLARQAGYHPLEINASDDRSAGALEAKIRAAVEMQSVMSMGGGGPPRPNCVILDEIDGVQGESSGSENTIAMLVRLVTAEPRSKAKGGKGGKDDEGGGDEDDSDGEADTGADADSSSKPSRSSGDGKKKSSRPPPLRRPIIAICNDQFAAALRPLRQLARVFEFTSASKSRFVDRLKYVTRAEGMQVETRVLAAVADVTDCDIRSALNMLQFAHSRSVASGGTGAALTAAALNNLSVGRKDVEKSRSQVWEAVFSERAMKKDQLLVCRDARETESFNNRIGGGAVTAGGSSTAASSAPAALSAKDSKSRELAGLLQDSGDMDKILEGIFHNYPLVGYSDPSFNKTVECADWLAYADLLDARMSQDVDLSLAAFVPYAAIGVHHLTCRPRKVKVEFPTMYYHQYVAAQRNAQVLRSFLAPSNSFTLSGLAPTRAVMDVLPHVLDILHPGIRAVNFQLLTQREKGELANLVDTMLSLAVIYRPEVQANFGATFVPAWKQTVAGGGEGANVVYKLEPAIDMLSEWSDPLDANTARQFEPNKPDRFGKRGAFGQMTPVQPTFKIDKRDVNMPNKVKREVMRELEFESMRRAEAARNARFSEDGATPASATSAAGTPAAAAAPAAPPVSLMSPAVQRLLDAERQKRERDAEALASPAAKGGAAPAEEDPSPATKRARYSASLNFLSRHADAARNNKARNRRAPAAKLDLAALKTERESKESEGSGSTSTDMPPPALPVRLVHPLHYKYNDGCTNAVRRTIDVAHFLPL